MKKIILPIFASCLLPMINEANAQVHFDAINQFKYDEKILNQLPISSLRVIDDDQFVFSNLQLKEDWNNFFNTQAFALKNKQEEIMHWAGYTSINPKLLIALMEQQSQILSDPDLVNFNKPFTTLSNKTGFINQLKDVSLKLSQRFYLFLEAQENGTIKTESLKNTTAATISLTSLLYGNNQKKHGGINSSDNSKKINDFLNTYQRLFNRSDDNLLLQNALHINSKASDLSNISANSNFNMNLPWQSGYPWVSGGAHSNTGSGYPYSSLDFNNGSGGWGSNTPWVQASHEGVVTRYSRCNIRITHPSGYATSYYHMDSLQYNTGDSVASGAWLGRYANNKQTALCEGGQSSGPHVHFSLLYNGRYTSLHNHYISGYRIDIGNYNYDDNCGRFYFEYNGSRTCAWRSLWR
ncbi:M23 family metallopeptidase [Pseudoalteromonas denitrificans]|uniref:LasA protease n=1 Tax=Pseudoalteromonas denitrificans DSM 6059 TaxID=1123010 RepID=A0A1I1MZX5_9GAMM|nr:M23 family metallopeptidase [Pseudoalteromonas denitrificans]SFC90656.1 LasA protease [Pseudoalteromonas denitrificans DSM 6059]